MADHYTALGLAPYAEQAAIREAYLALMRRYHPDRNESAAAAVRVREVTAAYEVLGDPDSRLDYDLARAEAHAGAAGRETLRPGRARAMVALLPLSGALLLVLLVYEPVAPGEQSMPTPSSIASPTPRAAPDRPPGAASAEPGPRLTADDESSSHARRARRDPVAISQAARPVSQLATAASVPSPRERPRPADDLRNARGDQSPSIKPRAPAAPPPVTMAPQHRIADRKEASQSCGNSTGTAASTCNSAAVAGLDRSLGLLFKQSVQRADKAKQGSLYRDHHRFVARLNACSSEACSRREYLNRMREVTTTMSTPPHSPGK